MSLPRSVRNQAKAAAEHFEKPAVEDDPVLDGAPEDGNDEPGAEGPVDDAAKTPEKPFEDKAADEPQEVDRDASYWRHRHNVLQGKYNAEVPKLHTEIRELKQTIAEKDRELESASKAAPAQQGDLTDEQMAEFKEAFGEEVVDFVTRMVKQNSGAAAKPDSNVEDLEARLARMEREKQEDAEARFWSDLEAAVPNYVEINNDVAFLKWLGEINPDTRQTYQADLIAAQEASDARGVANVFKLFLKQSQAPVKEPRKEVPEEDVEPKSSRSTQTPPNAGRGRTWSGADIAQFYRDKTSGKIPKDEAQRLEADIFAAQKEGRVTS